MAAVAPLVGAAGGPALGVPPVPPALAPPLPFPADAGTITGWLVDQSVTVTSSSLVQDIEAGFARLSQNIPADPLHATYAGTMRDLVDEVVNSSDLCCYLTISETGATATRVTVVHSIGKYSAGFGALSAFQGTTMGFLGEVVGENMPVFVQAPTTAGDQDLISSFALREIAVPTEVELVAYFSSAAAGNLMTPIAPTLANTTRLARLCPIPHAWAAYFLGSQSPFEAWNTGTSLVETLDTPDQRDRAMPFLNWLRAACVKRGLAAGDRRFSCLDTSWAALAPDARVVRWAAGRLVPYKKALPNVTGHPGTGLVTAPVAMAATAAIAASAAKEYTPLEVQILQAACTLASDVYEAELPEVFTRMLEEGRTTTKVKAVMRELLVPDEDDSFQAIQILVTNEMAKDFKDLEFGYNGDTSYSTCHRGISPFMVIPVSLAVASQRRRAADRYARVGGNLTLEEVTGAETAPDSTPRSYTELMDLLRSYMFYLQRLFGARCSHFQEVRAITRILGRSRREFEGITPRQVATILWHVFTDARRFFSTTIDLTGCLPESNLRVARGMIATTMIPEMVNVPYDQLLGTDSDTRAGSGGQASFEQPRGDRSGDAAVGERVFSRVPGPMKSALSGARSKYPDIRISDLMNAVSPPIRYSNIRGGPTGACLDMLYLGSCNEPSCTYKHPSTRISLDPARASAAATKLKAGYVAYIESHPS